MNRSGDERPLSRRRFVTGTAAGAAALALPAWLRPAGRALDVASARGVDPFTTRLPIPREIRSANITIPIQQAEIQVLPGRKTTMWTYGGTFPGPTVRRPSGQRTNVTFQHRLPSRAGELTVHLHGAHTRSDDDGQPGGLTESQPRSLYCDISPRLSERAAGNDLLIYPGDERTYRHDFVEDGDQERGAMHWYHDHRLDKTGENVWRGLAGMWITEDDVDAELNVPRGTRDLSLMIADRSFNAQNQLTSPFGKKPPNDGVTGKYVLVNGAIQPFHPVSAQRYRLRILNASNFRPYNLAFDSPVALPVSQIATESGLMPQAIERDQIFIGPGERVELIVDFSEARGEKIVLESVARSDGDRSRGAVPYRGPLMQFRVSNQPSADSTDQPQDLDLPPLPSWTQAVSASDPFDKVWTVSGGSVLDPVWKINGNTFDPNRVDATPKRGDVVVWRIVNGTSTSHLMHPHHTDWYLIGRNDSPPPAHEQCLKETFFMLPDERITIAGKMSDYLGKFVLHCHMLDHEDHGLMSQFEVVR